MIDTKSSSKPETTEAHKAQSIRHIQKLIALGGLIVILAIAFLISSLHSSNKSAGYQTVEQNFIKYVQNKDQRDADALETTNFKNTVKKNLLTTSFEKYCDSGNSACEQIFSNSFLNTAVKTTVNYTSPTKAKGKSIEYLYKGYRVNGTACTITVKLGIALVPNHKTWAVDDVGLNLSDASSSCSSK